MFLLIKAQQRFLVKHSSWVEHLKSISLSTLSWLAKWTTSLSRPPLPRTAHGWGTAGLPQLSKLAEELVPRSSWAESWDSCFHPKTEISASPSFLQPAMGQKGTMTTGWESSRAGLHLSCSIPQYLTQWPVVHTYSRSDIWPLQHHACITYFKNAFLFWCSINF